MRLAEPVAARHKFRLALENHKDHLVAEKLEVLTRISSEYVGLCVDVINNVALLEDPLETARAFAPFAWTVHINPMLKLAKEKGVVQQTLVSRLPPAQQLELERRNVEQSLKFAREQLNL